MKIISNNLFKEINIFMNTEARQIEKDLFNFYFNFNEASVDAIMDSLELYQNIDGGFGQGIEPDFKLKDSSPMATSIGLRHLIKTSDNNKNILLISNKMRKNYFLKIE